jgi:hypothetical protein
MTQILHIPKIIFGVSRTLIAIILLGLTLRQLSQFLIEIVDAPSL